MGNLKIEPLEIARGLWQQTHPKSAVTDAPQLNNDTAKAIQEK